MTTRFETDGCLSNDQLERLHARELEAETAVAAQAHLDECDACAARARQMSRIHDTWGSRMRAAGKPPDEDGDRRRTPTALAVDAATGYRIDGELARGGQGVVYRAWHEATRRTVAFKVLRDGALASQAARQRFQ